MKVIERLLLTALALAPVVGRAGDVSAETKAVESVRKLYAETVRRHPIGLPQGGDMQAFAPLLTHALRTKIAHAAACGADWHRQNPGNDLKPTYGWLELGIFSGGIEHVSPSAFVVEQPVLQQNSVIRVPVTLVRVERSEGPWIWHVSVSVASENGRYLIDDVTFEGTRPDGQEPRLSWFLSEGCDGARWVGLGHASE
ncbi:hypothetical protein ACFJGW_00970 [Burkholderiaceae bacterium UC74_6]